MKKRIPLILLLLICAVLFCACAGNPSKEQNNDEQNAAIEIGTAEELCKFIQSGETNAVLTDTIDVSDTMLRLTAERGEVTIEGNGHAILGNGDCVFRLEDGAGLILNNLTIEAQVNGLGLLGNSRIGGDCTVIRASENAVYAEGKVELAPGSILAFESDSGYGIYCAGLEIGSNSQIDVHTVDSQSVDTGRKDLILRENSTLRVTGSTYSAVKIGGTLALHDGTCMDVENTGDFHALNVGTIEVDGSVTLNAIGGEKGIGLFIVDLYDDIEVYGRCEPELRQENGDGSLKFLGDQPEA